jgi:hypothetical protein
MPTEDAGDVYRVVWPLAPLHETGQTRGATSRVKDLNGKRIGFIWDYLFHGDDLFAAVQEHLAAAYEDVEFVGYREFGNIHGADEHDVIKQLPDVLRRTGVDSVIAAVGA